MQDSAIVAFGKEVAVGDFVAYPVISRGQQHMKRIKITEILDGKLRGFDPDSLHHRMKTISNLKMTVLNAET